MISKEQVFALLAGMGSYSDEEMERYAPIAEKNYHLLADNVPLDSERDESRYAYYIAAKTNYEISLISGCSSTVTSFKAGDLAITEGNSHALAKEIYLSALADVRDLVSDDEFAFLGV